MKKLQIPLEEDKFYHIFNRGNNGECLFYKPENYQFFLRRLDEYLSPYIELYAFCLLPNHFHLLVRVKEKALVSGKALHLEDAKLLVGSATTAEEALLFQKAKLLGDGDDLISRAFHRFFTSYAKAINKQQKRHGSLFENPFKRIEVSSTRYLANLVFYIHANSQHHGIDDDFRQYPWSSYQRIISGKPSKLKKDDVLAWFKDADNYIAYHAKKLDLEQIKELIIE